MTIKLSTKCSTFFLAAAAILAMAKSSGAQAPKFLGNIWKSSWGAAPQSFSELFTQVTPENAGKWGRTEKVKGHFNWEALDSMYEWAEKSGAVTKQHTFVWGMQQPAWTDSFSSETEAKAAVENWIKSYMDRYGEKVDMIDVVNEPLHQKAGYREFLGGNGATGWDWAVWTFETVRKHAPDAKLHINDFGILKSGTATTNYLKIINILKEKNLIDGIGVQGHFMEGTSASTIKANLDKLAETGLPIHVSEYDVNESDDQKQLDIYKAQFPVFWLHPSVIGVTLWGYQQGKIWRDKAYLENSDGTDRPALAWLRSYIKETTDGKARKNQPLWPARAQKTAYSLRPAHVFDAKGRLCADNSTASAKSMFILPAHLQNASSKKGIDLKRKARQ